MKKIDAINLAAFAHVTNHTLPVEHAYKVVKLRKELRAIIEEISKDEEALRQDAGITNPQAFDNELRELRENKERTPEQDKRLEEMNGILQRFFDLRAKMLSEEVTLTAKTMPYEMWHQLQVENSKKVIDGKEVDILSGYVEDLLEGVLWEAPKED